jgi:hypothetical protein
MPIFSSSGPAKNYEVCFNEGGGSADSDEYVSKKLSKMWWALVKEAALFSMPFYQCTTGFIRRRLAYGLHFSRIPSASKAIITQIVERLNFNNDAYARFDDSGIHAVFVLEVDKFNELSGVSLANFINRCSTAFNSEVDTPLKVTNPPWKAWFNSYGNYDAIVSDCSPRRGIVALCNSNDAKLIAKAPKMLELLKIISTKNISSDIKKNICDCISTIEDPSRLEGA